MSKAAPKILHMTPVQRGWIAYYAAEDDGPAEGFPVLALATYMDRTGCTNIAPVVATRDGMKICGLYETLAPDLPGDEEAARYLYVRP